MNQIANHLNLIIVLEENKKRLPNDKNLVVFNCYKQIKIRSLFFNIEVNGRT